MGGWTGVMLDEVASGERSNVMYDEVASTLFCRSVIVPWQ